MLHTHNPRTEDKKIHIFHSFFLLAGNCSWGRLNYLIHSQHVISVISMLILLRVHQRLQACHNLGNCLDATLCTYQRTTHDTIDLLPRSSTSLNSTLTTHKNLRATQRKEENTMLQIIVCRNKYLGAEHFPFVF